MDWYQLTLLDVSRGRVPDVMKDRVGRVSQELMYLFMVLKSFLNNVFGKFNVFRSVNNNAMNIVDIQDFVSEGFGSGGGDITCGMYGSL